jgi:VanZ family protein
VVAIAWASLIFSMSALPGSRVPGRLGPLAHFVEYAVFAALLYVALRVDMDGRRAALLAVVIASAYAVTDEFHQSFVPLRTPDPVDWLVDTIGAAAGALGARALEARVGRKQAEKA